MKSVLVFLKSDFGPSGSFMVQNEFVNIFPIRQNFDRDCTKYGELFGNMDILILIPPIHKHKMFLFFINVLLSL